MLALKIVILVVLVICWLYVTYKVIKTYNSAFKG